MDDQKTKKAEMSFLKRTFSPPATGSEKRRYAYLIVEFLVLFVGVPTAYLVGWFRLDRMVMLWIFSICCLLTLLRDPDFNVRQLWDASHWRKRLPSIILPFAAIASLLFLYALLWKPYLLFATPYRGSSMWAFVFLFYPLLSVYPQGIIYRAFLFHRYGALFPSNDERVFVSAVAFAYVHITYANLAIVLITLFGGILFARTYARSRSLVISGMEHSLYGNFLFIVGLWKYLFAPAFHI